MSEVTLKAIAEVVQAELKLQLDPINTKLEAIGETVASHTASLDAIAKDVKDLNDAKKVNHERFDKGEKAIKFVAGKVGVAGEVAKIFQG